MEVLHRIEQKLLFVHDDRDKHILREYGMCATCEPQTVLFADKYNKRVKALNIATGDLKTIYFSQCYVESVLQIDLGNELIAIERKPSSERM